MSLVRWDGGGPWVWSVRQWSWYLTNLPHTTILKRRFFTIISFRHERFIRNNRLLSLPSVVSRFYGRGCVVSLLVRIAALGTTVRVRRWWRQLYWAKRPLWLEASSETPRLFQVSVGLIELNVEVRWHCRSRFALLELQRGFTRGTENNGLLICLSLH